MGLAALTSRLPPLRPVRQHNDTPARAATVTRCNVPASETDQHDRQLGVVDRPATGFVAGDEKHGGSHLAPKMSEANMSTTPDARRPARMSADTPSAVTRRAASR
jgi:hypothetical protein